MAGRAYSSVVLAAVMVAVPPSLSHAQSDGIAPPRSLSTLEGGAFEVETGLTFRAQALKVFEGHTSTSPAMMTSEFVPSPYLRLLTPFRALHLEERPDGGVERVGYYWKFAYNEFTLDLQEDPETGGIGSSSPRHDYGTRVDGYFLAAAPVLAVDWITADGRALLSMGVGIGIGYLSLAGEFAVEEPLGSGTFVRKKADLDGPAISLFVLGRYAYKMLGLGFEMGIAATDTEPYSYSQSYIALDVGLRMLL